MENNMEDSERTNSADSRLERTSIAKKCLLGGVSFFAGFLDGLRPEIRSYGITSPFISAFAEDIKIRRISQEEYDNSPRFELDIGYKATDLAVNLSLYFFVYIAGQQAGQLVKNLA